MTGENGTGNREALELRGRFDSISTVETAARLRPCVGFRYIGERPTGGKEFWDTHELYYGMWLPWKKRGSEETEEMFTFILDNTLSSKPTELRSEIVIPKQQLDTRPIHIEGEVRAGPFSHSRAS